MNWLDLALAVFLIIYIIIGIKRGFMTSVLSNFSFGAIAILAFFLYKPLNNLLNNWFGLENAIYGSYYRKLVSFSADFETNLISMEQSQLNPFVKYVLASGAIPVIPKIMFNIFLNNKSLYTKLQSSGLEYRSLGEIVSKTYANFFSSLISFAITFVLLFLIVILIRLLINKLRTVGFVKIVDNILGAFYGIVQGLLILVGVCFIIKLLSPISFMKPVTNYISNSFFGKIVYNQITNLLDNFFSYSDIINSIFK